jgi:hypothetical protein
VKKNNLLLLLLLLIASCVQVNQDGSSSDITNQDSLKKNNSAGWIKSDEFYSVYYLRNLNINITNIRPQQSDTSIKLCIPAAFTQLDDGNIDGLFIVNGKIIIKKVNHHLGGGFLLVNKKVSIIKTDDGKLLTDSLIDSLVNLKASFFQQIQLVRDGEHLEFQKDQKLFQRRAVVLYYNGDIAVVESKTAITLQEFADDLVKMKVENAIYTDMGSYDEGWVRNPANGGIQVIGLNRSQTQYQSNWLIFSN